jgi:hypothetical protein
MLGFSEWAAEREDDLLIETWNKNFDLYSGFVLTIFNTPHENFQFRPSDATLR